jgi:hypothetical protein
MTNKPDFTNHIGDDYERMEDNKNNYIGENKMSDLELLKESLELHIENWDIKKRHAPNKEYEIKYNCMSFLAQWIINSIKGDINKPHVTNICNIVLNTDFELKEYIGNLNGDE